MRLGFVGLGAMGELIVPRLMAAGHEVTGWNRSRDKAVMLVEAGMLWADTPRAVAQASEIVFSIVTDAKAVRSFLINASSITTSAMQPLGRHLTKPARPTSTLSSFKPRPEGSSTPSGATTRINRLLASAVLSTITVSPTLARSSAVTLWISAHCSDLAPGGVSQRICQSLCTDLTAPWAKA